MFQAEKIEADRRHSSGKGLTVLPARWGDAEQMQTGQRPRAKTRGEAETTGELRGPPQGPRTAQL